MQRIHANHQTHQTITFQHACTFAENCDMVQCFKHVVQLPRRVGFQDISARDDPTLEDLVCNEADASDEQECKQLQCCWYAVEGYHKANQSLRWPRLQAERWQVASAVSLGVESGHNAGCTGGQPVSLARHDCWHALYRALPAAAACKLQDTIL